MTISRQACQIVKKLKHALVVVDLIDHQCRGIFFLISEMKSKYRFVQNLSYIVTRDITCKEYEKKELRFLFARNGTRAPWQCKRRPGSLKASQCQEKIILNYIYFQFSSKPSFINWKWWLAFWICNLWSYRPRNGTTSWNHHHTYMTYAKISESNQDIYMVI